MTTIFTTIRTGAVALAALGCMAAALPARAADADPLPQGEFDVTGIDFGSPHGVSVAIARLHRVAFEICSPDGSPKAWISPESRACYNTAIATGMAQIHTRQLAAQQRSAVRVATGTPASQPHP